jgi:mRNA-degrading endonuclease RelE of RelBE toxin-antitoxin system
MFEVAYHPEAAKELRALRAHDRARVLDAIERHLFETPLMLTRNKKILDLGEEGFIHQLRVGEFRVFYDVEEIERIVIVRHVRRKGRKTTGEVL